MPALTLTDSVREHVCAAFPGLWVRTLEPDDAESEIARLCLDRDWGFHHWDCDRGLHHEDPQATDPLAVVKSLPTLATGGKTTLLVMRNLHRFLGSIEMVQALETAFLEGKQSGRILLVLAPVVDLPVELERAFVVLDHELPDRAGLEAIAYGVDPEGFAALPQDDRDTLTTASAGLTRTEAEGAYALAVVRHNKIQPATVWELKSAALKKSGLLELHQGGERFSDLGGLEALKEFCAKALRPGARRAQPRGVLLLGLPGVGKSAFAKALGTETGRPTLTLDLGSLMGSLVGQTEERTRKALKIADAMAPCVLYCDELDRQFTAGSGANDGGVGQRILQSFLTWMNDHTSQVFFVGTSNDIQSLPSAFTRAERWDGVFFLDFPSPAQRVAIWRLYTEYYGLDVSQTTSMPKDENWTGAEIKSCCRLASLLDVPLTVAALNVVPIAQSSGDTVQRLRTWAHGRCLSADRPGLYQSTTAPKPDQGGGPRRSIERLEPGLN